MLETPTCQIINFAEWGMKQTAPAATMSELTSALGRRVAALSLAFQEELMDDDTILDYLEEVTRACRRELEALPTEPLHLTSVVSGLR